MTKQKPITLTLRRSSVDKPLTVSLGGDSLVAETKIVLNDCRRLIEALIVHDRGQSGGMESSYRDSLNRIDNLLKAIEQTVQPVKAEQEFKGEGGYGDDEG